MALDIDGGLIYHIASGGPETLVAAISMGIRPEFLGENAAKALSFAADHHAQTGLVPATGDFQAIFGQKIVAQTGVAPAIIFQQVMKRQMFRKVMSGKIAVEARLKDNDPYGAYAVWKQQEEQIKALQPNFVKPTPLWSMAGVAEQNYELIKSGKLGIPSPWESLNAMTMGFWPKTNTWFVARPGTGKCIKNNTPVLDVETGQYRTIQEVVDRKCAVLSRNMKTGEIYPRMPDAHLNTGKKECLRVGFRSGRHLIVTPEHPLLTVDGWRRTDALTVGEFVEVARTIPEPLTPTDPGEHIPIILGMMIADGALTGSDLRFTKPDPEVREALSAALGAVGCRLSAGKGGREWGVTRMEPIGRNGASLLLEEYGQRGLKSPERFAHDRVYSFRNDRLAAFLGSLWSCDGEIDKRGNIVYSTSSKRLAHDVQRLLLRFSIVSRVAYKAASYVGKSGVRRHFDSWRVIVASTCVPQFVEKIPLWGKRARDIKHTRQPVNPNVDLIPMTSGLASRIKEAWSLGVRRGVSPSGLADKLGWKAISPNKLTRRKHVSRRVLSAFVDVFGVDDLGHLLVNQWDAIESITVDGVHDVCDLTVMGDHCFVANDVVVHNTWLQIICANYAWSLRNRSDDEQKVFNVLVISPEMSKMSMAERFFVIQAEVGYGAVVGGTLGHFGEQKYFARMKQLQEQSGIWILDATDGLTPDRIEAAIDAVEAHLVVIDSVYKIKWKERAKDRFENMYCGVDTISSWAKRDWKDGREVAFIAASQMNKMGAKKGGAQQTSVALADNLNWEADNLFFVEQTEDMKHDKRLRLLTGKCRRMAEYRKSILLRWDMETMDFSEVPEVKKAKPKFKDTGFAESPY